jgi:hypothetical protein
MTARLRTATPVIALVALLVSACSAGTAASPTAAPIATAAASAASFTLTLGSKAYATSPTPASSSCKTPATGPWTFLYTAAAFGSTDFLTLDLTLYDGAATAAESPNFRLTIADFDYIDQLGKVSGSHGSTGAATVTKDGANAHIAITGVAAEPGARTTLTPVTFDLSCPVS